MLFTLRFCAAGLFGILLLGCAPAFAQTSDKDHQNPSSQSSQSNPQPRPASSQTVVVTAKLTPAEIEDWKINEAYQSVYKLEEQHDCAGAIDKYRSVVIPLAEESKFDRPRNKFLFLSYRGIGDCDLSMGRFAEAEKMFQKLFQYASDWPGLDDSDYPINYRSIGLARMSQQNWKGAEESLQKAITIFDEQIERVAHWDSDMARTEQSNFLRESQDVALNLLAVVYFREERSPEALSILERAYKQAVEFHAPSALLKKIEENGLAISTVAGDSAAIAIWSQRPNASKL